MTGRASSLQKRAKDSYLQCIEQYIPLRSISNDEHLADATKVLNLLMDMDRDKGEEEYFLALTDLVETYEQSMDCVTNKYRLSPSDFLASLIENRGISQSDLAAGADIGKSTISDILAGRRTASKAVAKKLSDFFQMRIDAFIE